jgi:hypothetical protein
MGTGTPPEEEPRESFINRLITRIETMLNCDTPECTWDYLCKVLKKGNITKSEFDYVVEECGILEGL